MRKIIPLIFSIFSSLALLGQANGGWGTCEFTTVAAMNAYDPSGSNFSCKKVFVQATDEHYFWDGSIWVLESDDGENIYNTSGTLTTDRVLEGDANSLFFEGLDSMYIEGTNIELDASNNLTFFAANTIEFELDATDGKGIYIASNGDVGMGISAPLSLLHIYEATGTAASASDGTIVLEHGNSGGESSIVFKSNVNSGSDYAYINYNDDGSGNGSTSENGLLTIGIENDAVGANQDDIAILPTGSLGIGTQSPDAFLDVDGGSVQFSDYGVGTYEDTTAVYLLGVEADGDIMEMNTARNSRVFYPPALLIDASSTGTSLTLDLHQQYISMFGNPAVASSGAPGAIPTYAETELYYYVTDYDNTVFSNLSISTAGVLTYDIIAVPTDNCSILNVVFVVK